MQKVTYYVRRIYGKPHIYLTGPVGKQVRVLTRRLTVDKTDLKALEAMGFEIEQVIDPRLTNNQ